MKKYEKIMLSLTAPVIALAPFSVAISCGSGERDLEYRHKIVAWAPENKTNWGDVRAYDMSFQSKNMVSRTYFEAVTPMIFRTETTAEADVSVLPDGGTVINSPAMYETKFDAIASARVDVDTTKGTTVSNMNHLKEILDANVDGGKSVSFIAHQGVKYVNSLGEETQYEFKSKDFYYGFLRGIYASKSVREDGNIEEYNTGIPTVTSAYEDTLTGEYWDELNNGNVYLYNLYGLNVAKTILANEANITNGIDEFTLVFDGKIKFDTLKGLLGNVTTIAPVSSQKIDEMRPNDTTIDTPGKYLQLKEYGAKVETNGKYDLTDELLVSRYYISNYDLNKDTNGIILKKNIYSFDKFFNARENTINEYQQLFYDPTIDKEVLKLDRKVGFIKDNSESIMFGSIRETESLLNEVINSGNFSWVVPQNTGLSRGTGWVPFNFIMEADLLSEVHNEPFNTGGLELFFGKGSTKTNVIESPTADYEYTFKSGNIMRAILNSSVNLYTLTQSFRSNMEQIKDPIFFKSGNAMTLGGPSYNDYITDNPNKSGISEAVFITKLAAQEEWYKTNSSSSSGAADSNILLKPSDEQFAAASAALVDLYNSNVTDKNTVAIVPVFDSFNAKEPTTKEITAAYTKLVAYLNTLAPNKVKFVEFETKAKVNSQIWGPSSPNRYLGMGPDYDSSASFLHQIVSANYGYSIGLITLEAAFSDSNSLNSVGFTADIDASDIYARGSSPVLANLKEWATSEINNNALIYPLLKKRLIDDNDLASMSLDDFRKIRDNDFDDDTHDNEIKSLYGEQTYLFGKYFLSIAPNTPDNLALIAQWTQFITNFSGNNLLAMGSSYSSMTSLRLGESPDAVKQYSSKWLKLSSTPPGTSYPFQLHLTSVDPK
ncbi:hypothetical protein [Candidatus Mycoplasma mahonii]|uniref:hypothetical protein n=1 Tax=Candidatus Mycoplasma mahonii TaxID=3004105 RepID=UPI0026F2C0AA|nr:hypothetical protein [Candidatus Mycoplasma mahonii]WKX02341.1 hypothetical protein O3I44_02965 [Candidatus Mycoplasma mahonii]